jgi:cell division protein FtsB
MNNYIAKQQNELQNIESSVRMELFITETLLDVNGESVTISRSIGFYSIDDLQRQKDGLQAQMDDLDTKIATINGQIKVMNTTQQIKP